MRKIDKSIIPAVKYKHWLDNLIQNGKKHPAYTSSKGKFYYDIIASLMWIQEGLCAYSERRLQDHSPFKPDKWQNGELGRFEFAGQLDHFDHLLKEDFGWLWDNLFLIDGDINVKKKWTNRPSGLLKPDLVNFNAADYLEYDTALHAFIPKRTNPFDMQEKIRQDISFLGLNFQPIIDIRKQYLAPIIYDVKYKVKTFSAAKSELIQFFTAFELSEQYMNN